MTYCVAMRLDAGLVFLSDSRTNAGVDQVGTFRKMCVFEVPGERVLVLMTSGNLSVSQSVRHLIDRETMADGRNIWNVTNMYDAAQVVGQAIRQIYQQDAASLSTFGIDFNIGLILGGQIRGEPCRLFNLYAAGNFIESHDENPYFQIGESKYGKPIIDRVIRPSTSLAEAAKCALISMDSTLRSNVSVGLPLDLMVYDVNSFTVGRFVTIQEDNQYFGMIRRTWGQRLRQVFEELADPVWNADQATTVNALSCDITHNENVHLKRQAVNNNGY